MNDFEFDEMLRRSAPSPSPEAQATAVRLVEEVRDHVVEATPMRRRAAAVAGTFAGAVALAGAGTLTAYQLSVPPFQGIEQGASRARTGIPVTYTNSVGRVVECLAFIEYRNLSTEQQAAIEEVARDDRWHGYGQRVLDGLDVPTASPEQQWVAIVDAVHRDLWKAASDAVPGMVYMKDAAGPVLHGTSMSCAGPGGIDGRA